jgi:phospholipid-translocating ATPase
MDELELLDGDINIFAFPPDKEIYKFTGNSKKSKDDDRPSGLKLDHTAWANTVMASQGYLLGCVVYSGIETRSQMN